jgi:hypothetical protein
MSNSPPKKMLRIHKIYNLAAIQNFLETDLIRQRFASFLKRFLLPNLIEVIKGWLSFIKNKDIEDVNV